MMRFKSDRQRKAVMAKYKRYDKVWDSGTAAVVVDIDDNCPNHVIIKEVGNLNSQHRNIEIPYLRHISYISPRRTKAKLTYRKHKNQAQPATEALMMKESGYNYLRK